MPIKTFRGLIAHNAIDTISLHTNDGSMGYRIVKFQVIPQAPTSATSEGVVQIFKVPQTAASDVVDFSDQTLLGMAFYNQDSTPSNNVSQVIIFDQDIVNQDIYITCVDHPLNSPFMNYYIELEQVKLDLSENTVATLKDMRNIASQ